jgi:hypothetical protein
VVSQNSSRDQNGTVLARKKLNTLASTLHDDFGWERWGEDNRDVIVKVSKPYVQFTTTNEAFGRLTPESREIGESTTSH